MKRLLDILLAGFGLVLSTPIILPSLCAVWLQDFQSPFYIAKRVGKNKNVFKMIKIRSMIVNADKSGVDSTSADDKRITIIGKIIRKFKIDELAQLWNVIIGDMSLVGPRPNVQSEVSLYTEIETHLLDIKPGITDFASIVFADENEILEGSSDPDLLYNQIIRPWKSRLGLLYVNNHNLNVDIWIIGLTILAIVSRDNALSGLQKLLMQIGADNKLVEIAGRKIDLYPYPPPGSDKIVLSRKIL